MRELLGLPLPHLLSNDPTNELFKFPFYVFLGEIPTLTPTALHVRTPTEVVLTRIQ
jgi:hypothetical protein